MYFSIGSCVAIPRIHNLPRRRNEIPRKRNYKNIRTFPAHFEQGHGGQINIASKNITSNCFIRGGSRFQGKEGGGGSG